MSISILYRPNSDHERPVEEYVREFDRRHHRNIELISLNTKRGADLARLYDIVRYPAVLATAENGQLLKSWSDESLPLMDEVMAYTLA